MHRNTRWFVKHKEIIIIKNRRSKQQLCGCRRILYRHLGSGTHWRNTNAIVQLQSIADFDTAAINAHFALAQGTVKTRPGHTLQVPGQEIVQALPRGLLVHGEKPDAGRCLTVAITWHAVLNPCYS